jgi:hypothetical protein
VASGNGDGEKKNKNPYWLKRYQWKPGQSGNAKGGPGRGTRGRPNIDKEIQDYFYNVTKRKTIDGVRKQMSYAEIAIRKLAMMVEKGNWSAIKYVIERFGGLPTVRHEITGIEGEPFKVEIEIKHTKANDNTDPSEQPPG